MLLAEFGLIFGNDWFIVPLDLAVGSVFHLTRFAVRDTFGVESVVGPSRNTDGRRGRCSASRRKPAFRRAARRVLPGADVVSKLQGDPLEEVALFRDEMANMVWGVERRVQGASGEPYDRYHETTQQAAQELVQGNDEAALSADILYRLATSVPENWIPFVAVPATGQSAGQPLQHPARTARAGSHTVWRHITTRDPKGVLLRHRPDARCRQRADTAPGGRGSAA